MKTETWLDLRNIEAWLGGRPVLHNLNLQLTLRQSTTVLGPNGAGKSSLVKLIDRSLYPIVRPDSHLRLFGSETVNLWSLRSRLGVVSGELEQRLHPKTAVDEVVVSSFFGATRLGRDQQPNPAQWEQVRDLLDQLQLNGIRERCYGELSDGQRRRLLIARALVHQPEVLVLDEPSRALDLRACHQLLAILQGLIKAGTTVVQVTHRVDTIVPEMQRVLFLDGGTIVRSGAPTELLRPKKLSELFKTPLEVVEKNGFRQVLPAPA
jgi:iron complex transport system ATP-binding protein